MGPRHQNEVRGTSKVLTISQGPMGSTMLLLGNLFSLYLDILSNSQLTWPQQFFE